MRTIAGKYNGTVITDRESVNVDDFFLDVECVNKNIISVHFQRFKHHFKLTCVIHKEDDKVHIHVMDKFTAKFHVQGKTMKGHYKSGIHGVWDRALKSLKLDLIINEFNQSPIRFSFVGQKSEESSKEAPLGSTSLFFF